MNSRFDQEFYKSEWQRVLPLGPHGVEPYIQTSRISRPGDLRRDLRSVSAMLRAVTQGMLAFGRFAALGMAKRPMSSAAAPRAQRERPPLRLPTEGARAATRRAATRGLPRAA